LNVDEEHYQAEKNEILNNESPEHHSNGTQRGNSSYAHHSDGNFPMEDTIEMMVKKHQKRRYQDQERQQ
jgi:hypothetical protein